MTDKQATTPAPGGTPVPARPPVPPFDEASARVKVQAAEDAWNSCDPQRVAAAYTLDSQWRNRAEFVQGRAAIVTFLTVAVGDLRDLEPAVAEVSKVHTAPVFRVPGNRLGGLAVPARVVRDRSLLRTLRRSLASSAQPCHPVGRPSAEELKA